MKQIRDLAVRAATAPDRNERIEAYSQLVERFRDMACGYAYSILGDFHLGEDAAQDAFVAAFGRLDQLRTPEAFPGWFRRIVWSECSRVTREKKLPTTPFEAAADVQSEADGPDRLAEKKEMRDEVLKAIRQLSPQQREVTTLFYINGYSQKDIADFLEVPVGTVKNRLSASRRRLKERMLNMVEETLHQSAPDERFNENVIEKLLGAPKLLEIKDHPIFQVLKTIQAALPDYEVIQTGDVMDTQASLATTQDMLEGTCRTGQTYHPSDGTVLRTQITWQTLGAAKGRTPPVKLLIPGRVFSVQGWPDAQDLKVGHVCDWLCIEPGHDMDAARAILEPVIQAVLSPVDISVEAGQRNLGENSPIDRLITFSVKRGDELFGVCRGGLLTARLLQEAGFNPDTVGGGHFGFGLDRLAMAKLGIKDVRELWRPPYLRE